MPINNLLRCNYLFNTSTLGSTSSPSSSSNVPSSFLLSSSPLFPPMLPSLLSPSSASFPPSPSSSVASFFLSSLPFGPYHSPPSLLLLSPSSLEILQLCPLTVFHPLLPPFLLSSNLCTLFSHFSPSCHSFALVKLNQLNLRVADSVTVTVLTVGMYFSGLKTECPWLRCFNQFTTSMF